MLIYLVAIGAALAAWLVRGALDDREAEKDRLARASYRPALVPTQWYWDGDKFIDHAPEHADHHTWRVYRRLV